MHSDEQILQTETKCTIINVQEKNENNSIYQKIYHAYKITLDALQKAIFLINVFWLENQKFCLYVLLLVSIYLLVGVSWIRKFLFTFVYKNI